MNTYFFFLFFFFQKLTLFCQQNTLHGAGHSWPGTEHLWRTPPLHRARLSWTLTVTVDPVVRILSPGLGQIWTPQARVYMYSHVVGEKSHKSLSSCSSCSEEIESSVHVWPLLLFFKFSKFHFFCTFLMNSNRDYFLFLFIYEKFNTIKL